MKLERWRAMFNITQETADAVFSIGNLLIVLGLVIGLAGTACVVWSGKVREGFANERIAANEAETARAKQATAIALLEQQRLKASMAWRRVTRGQAQQLAAALEGGPQSFWVTTVGDDPEATTFHGDLLEALKAAGIKTKYFSGYARAVGLAVKGGTPEERQFLVRAFRSVGLHAFASEQPSMGKDKKELEVLVGSKPPPDFQWREDGTIGG